MTMDAKMLITKRQVRLVARALGFTAARRDDGSSIYGRPSAARSGKWNVTDETGQPRVAKPHEARKLNEAAGRFGYPLTYSIEIN